MTLQEYCASLPKKKQIQLATDLGEIALPIWKQYVENDSVSYRDSVVGLTHTIPKELLADTIKEVQNYILTPKLSRLFKSKTKLIKLYSYFDDPVIAIKDLDWEPPPVIENTFYSVYNLLGSIVDKDVTVLGDSTIYVSINQAIDAIMTAGVLTESQMEEIIKRAKNGN